MFCKEQRLSGSTPYDIQFLKKSYEVFACWWCMRVRKVSTRRTKNLDPKF